MNLDSIADGSRQLARVVKRPAAVQVCAPVGDATSSGVDSRGVSWHLATLNLAVEVIRLSPEAHRQITDVLCRRYHGAKLQWCTLQSAGGLLLFCFELWVWTAQLLVLVGERRRRGRCLADGWRRQFRRESARGLLLVCFAFRWRAARDRWRVSWSGGSVSVRDRWCRSWSSAVQVCGAVG